MSSKGLKSNVETELLKDQLLVSELEKHQIEAENETLKSELNDQVERNQELKEEIAQLKAVFWNEQSRLNPDSVKTPIDEKDRIICLLKDQTTELERKLARKQSNLESVERSRMALERRLNTNSQSSLTASEEEVVKRQKEANFDPGIHRLFIDLKDEIEARKQEVQIYQEEIQRERHRVQMMDANCCEKDVKIAELKSQLQFKISDFEQQIASLEDQLKPKEEDALTQFQLKLEQPIDPKSTVGTGSFGSAHEISINGVPCIVKRLLDILVGRGEEESVDPEQKMSIRKKFHRECVLLSQLRHPNIVQFLGVHIGEEDYDYTLIMERLTMDLERCLQNLKNIPLSIKLSILLDVSYGLNHLHSREQPIIHRDLTAANILLTSDMHAKIADLGVSKIIDINWVKPTQLPGALAYMPPEALTDPANYNTELDIFSFGVLALYTALQEFPEISLGEEIPFTVRKCDAEAYKRRKWMDMLGKKHPLYALIKQCLLSATKRPSAVELNLRLQKLCQDHPRKIQSTIEIYDHLCNLDQTK